MKDEFGMKRGKSNGRISSRKSQGESPARKGVQIKMAQMGENQTRATSEEPSEENRKSNMVSVTSEWREKSICPVNMSGKFRTFLFVPPGQMK